MDAVPENATVTRHNWPGWGVAAGVGALFGFSCTIILGAVLNNMRTRCNPPGWDPLDEVVPDRLRSVEARPYYCDAVPPDLNVALWSVVLGLVIGVAMAVVIGLRVRHDPDAAGRGPLPQPSAPRPATAHEPGAVSGSPRAVGRGFRAVR